MRYWDVAARVYDLQLALERPAIETSLELLQRSTDRVLDVATGTGAVLRSFAERVPPPAEAIGVDTSARDARLRSRPSRRLARDPWRCPGTSLPPTDASTWLFPDRANCAPVSDTAPGHPGYNGGRWRVVQAFGITSQLTNAGDVVAQATSFNDTGVRFACSLVPWGEKRRSHRRRRSKGDRRLTAEASDEHWKSASASCRLRQPVIHRRPT